MQKKSPTTSCDTDDSEYEDPSELKEITSYVHYRRILQGKCSVGRFFQYNSPDIRGEQRIDYSGVSYLVTGDGIDVIVRRSVNDGYSLHTSHAVIYRYEESGNFVKLDCEDPSSAHLQGYFSKSLDIQLNVYNCSVSI